MPDSGAAASHSPSTPAADQPPPPPPPLPSPSPVPTAQAPQQPSSPSSDARHPATAVAQATPTQAAGSGPPSDLHLAREEQAMSAQEEQQRRAAQQLIHAQREQRKAAMLMRKRAALDDIVAQGVRLTKRGRPTDRAIAPHLRSAVPESGMYTQLRSMERQLDWNMARKRAELVQALQHAPHQARKLRVFLSHTCANQPLQPAPGPKPPLTGAEADLTGIQRTEQPSWTLRIEGRLLDPTARSRSNQAEGARSTAARIGAYKFSNLIRRMVIEFDAVDNKLQNANGYPVAEWQQPTPIPVPVGQNTGARSGPTAQAGATNGLEPAQLFSAPAPVDGFEVKRYGQRAVKAKILLYPASYPEKFRVADPLGSTLQLHFATRAEIVTALWSYIQKNNLLGTTDDRSLVQCDAALQAIFQAPCVNCVHVPEMINRFLLPPDPVLIEYWIRTDLVKHKAECAYDLDIDMDDFGNKIRGHEILSRFDAQANILKEVSDLDQRIAEAAVAARNHASVRDYLETFSQRPREHIHTWIASHAKELSTAVGTPVLGGKGTATQVGSEEVRRSETFRAPWVDEALVVAESHRNAMRFKSLQGTPATTTTTTHHHNPHPTTSNGSSGHRHELRSSNR